MTIYSKRHPIHERGKTELTDDDRDVFYIDVHGVDKEELGRYIDECMKKKISIGEAARTVKRAQQLEARGFTQAQIKSILKAVPMSMSDDITYW